MMKIAIIHEHTSTIVDSDQININLNELGNVSPSSCVSIHLADCMDYVPFAQRTALLDIALSKLRRGGEITISGTNLSAAIRDVYNHTLSIEQINATIYNHRLSVDTLDSIKNYLIDTKHLVVVNYKQEGLYFSIKMERPINDDSGTE